MEIKIATKEKIETPEIIIRIMREILSMSNEIDQKKEHFWTVGLNVRNQIEYVELVSLGILDQSVVHPREVFRFAIMKAVASIILIHNHPSGDPEPSAPDLAITDQLCKAGKIMGIEVIDHLILGAQEKYYSFKVEGKIQD